MGGDFDRDQQNQRPRRQQHLLDHAVFPIGAEQVFRGEQRRKQNRSPQNARRGAAQNGRIAAQRDRENGDGEREKNDRQKPAGGRARVKRQFAPQHPTASGGDAPKRFFGVRNGRAGPRLASMQASVYASVKGSGLSDSGA